MVFREQALTQLCRICKAEAVCACRSCGNLLCNNHRIRPSELCEGCAVEMYMVVSKAGRTTLTLGGSASIVFLAAAYVFAALEVLPALTVGLLVSGSILGAATLIWGRGAPKRAERKIERSFGNRKLPAPHGKSARTDLRDTKEKNSDE